MIVNNIEMNFSTKHLPLEYKILEWKLIINQELYDEKIIDLQVKSEMERNLMGRMTKVKSKYDNKNDLIISSYRNSIQVS